MALSNEQFATLVSLLAKRFQTDADRKFVLDMAFAEEPMLTQLVDGHNMDAESFASALITALTAQDYRTKRGETGIVKLLKTMRKIEPSSAEAYEPLIKALRGHRKPIPEAVSNDDPDQEAPEPEEDSDSRRQRHRRRSRVRRTVRKIRKVFKWQVLVALILVVTIIPLAGVAIFTTDASVRVQESLSSVQRVVKTLSGRTFLDFSLTDLDRLQASITELVESLQNARGQLRTLRFFSFLNADLGTTYDILTAAELDASAALEMLNGLQPALFFLIGDESSRNVNAQITSGERIVELLTIGQSQFTNAADQLAEAELLLNRLNFQNLSQRLVLQVQEIIQYHDQLKSLNRILQDAPELITKAFGLVEPQDYLVLSQNSDELRPSGGYISTWGWLRARRFRIVDFGYSATTSLSPNPPPDSMVSSLNIPDWWIKFPRPIYTAWDGSWYADFPSTAKMAAWYYDNGNNPASPVKGVISIDLIGFEYLLDAIGPVEITSSSEVISAANFRDVIYRIRSERGRDDPHKEFIATVVREIFTNWQGISGDKADKLLAAVLRALQEKHIMIYFQDERLNAVMNLLDWSGAQTPGTSDYLMVADANMGNKSNSTIRRELTYDVKIQPDGSLLSRATISYQYSAEDALNDPAVRVEHWGSTPDYGNLMQIFVPRGSQLASSNNIEDTIITDEGDKFSTLVAYVLVQYDTTERFQVAYTTPVVVERFGSYNRYRLILQKQPGTRSDLAVVQVTLPPGTRVVTINPEPTTSYTLDNPIIEFRVRLNVDQQIEIVYQ